MAAQSAVLNFRWEDVQTIDRLILKEGLAERDERARLGSDIRNPKKKTRSQSACFLPSRFRRIFNFYGSLAGMSRCPTKESRKIVALGPASFVVVQSERHSQTIRDEVEVSHGRLRGSHGEAGS
jgi:hypothetical protein